MLSVIRASFIIILEVSWKLVIMDIYAVIPAHVLNYRNTSELPLRLIQNEDCLYKKWKYLLHLESEAIAEEFCFLSNVQQGTTPPVVKQSLTAWKSMRHWCYISPDLCAW